MTDSIVTQGSQDCDTGTKEVFKMKKKRYLNNILFKTATIQDHLLVHNVTQKTKPELLPTHLIIFTIFVPFKV